jgi:hypothetical protein
VTRLLRLVLATLIALLLASPVLGCAPASSTHFAPSQDRLTSRDATVQAQANLELFFNALGSGDTAAANSLTAAGHAPTDWNVKLLVVESITALGTSGADQNTRVFRAPVRLWPGDASIDPGDLYDWTWTMKRGRDGRWLLWSWGYA